MTEMDPAVRRDYILQAIEDYGPMTPAKARAFLEQHDANVRARVLEEKAEQVFEDTRQKYSQVIATHGANKAGLWFTGREAVARLITGTPAPTSGPVGCRNCGDTAGPFDPTTGLCEDCLPGGGQ